MRQGATLAVLQHVSIDALSLFVEVSVEKSRGLPLTCIMVRMELVVSKGRLHPGDMTQAGIVCSKRAHVGHVKVPMMSVEQVHGCRLCPPRRMSRVPEGLLRAAWKSI